jgi:hypothetical protein
MPRATFLYDWTIYDPVIRRVHAAGGNGPAVLEAIRAAGYTGAWQTLNSRMFQKLGLFFTEPRVRPVSAEGASHCTAVSLPAAIREPIKLRLGPPRTLTAALMGDPRPGRTPWAA